jgi:microcystin-dependent protein
MAREVLQTGDIWTETIANAAVTPVIDGQDEYGSIELVADINMSDAPTELKSKTYAFLDRFKITVNAGLIVQYEGGFYFNSVGTLVTIAANSSFALPPSYQGLIYIDASGIVQYSNTLPTIGDPLALFTTNATDVTVLEDIRYQRLNCAKVLQLPAVAQAAFTSGDLKITLSNTVADGWLACEGQTVSALLYPDLFARIGYKYGGSGNNFVLPSVDDCQLLLTTLLSSVGDIGGSNDLILQTNQMPNHSHGVVETAHSHVGQDLGHTHTINQTPHKHTLVDPGHGHKARFHRQSSNPDSSPNPGNAVSTTGNGGFQTIDTEVTGITMANASIAISNNEAKATVLINPAKTNVSLSPTGGSTPIDLRGKTLKVRLLIKT